MPDKAPYCHNLSNDVVSFIGEKPLTVGHSIKLAAMMEFKDARYRNDL